MFKFLHDLVKHHRHHHRHTHPNKRTIRVGRNWFYFNSIPDPHHPEYEEQMRLCKIIIDDMLKYGLLYRHQHTWTISRDVHIPSLRYYLCVRRPEYSFRLHSHKSMLHPHTQQVTIWVERRQSVYRPFRTQG